jgi:predicted nucleotidyltransferase
MLTILRPGCSKIMQLFYKNKNASFHLREISRQTKLFEPSVYRFLNGLEKDNILKSIKEGNLKKYSIKKDIIAYYIFQAFDLEKFERLPNIRQNAVKTYLNSLPQQPIFIVLFGSTAKETFKEDSDIDILLITNQKIDTKKAEKEANALKGIKISSFQITFNNFLKELKMKEDKVVQSAINSGYPLLNHIYYYEALYNERI